MDDEKQKKIVESSKAKTLEQRLLSPVTLKEFLEFVEGSIIRNEATGYSDEIAFVDLIIQKLNLDYPNVKSFILYSLTLV